MASMLKHEEHGMDTSDSISAKLSFEQLRLAARKISVTKIDRVTRNLGLLDSDFEEVKYNIEQHAVEVTSNERRLAILEFWKNKSPEQCTLGNLLLALRSEGLNNTADDIAVALTDMSKEHQDLEQDSKCNSQVTITKTLADKLSHLIHVRYYKELGFELGLLREQIDKVGHDCKKNAEPDQYINNILKTWIELNGQQAVLGKVYRALRRIQCNDTANNVYGMCTSLAKLVEDIK